MKYRVPSRSNSQTLRPFSRSISIFTILALVGCQLQNASAANYNILSLDGAGEGGILTAQMLSYMEQRAFRIGEELLSQKELAGASCPDLSEKFSSNRFPLHKLFDMVAGSETGAIIAAIMAQPREDNPSEAKWNMTQVVQYFSDNTDTFYRNSTLGNGWKLLMFGLSVIIFGGAAFIMSNRCFLGIDHQDAMMQIKRTKELVEVSKKYLNGNIGSKDKFEEVKGNLRKSVNILQTDLNKEINSIQGDLDKILQDAEKKLSVDKKAECSDELEQLINLEQKLKVEDQKQKRRFAYPWYILLLSCIGIATIFNFMVIPAIDLAIVKNIEPEQLKDELSKYISPIPYEDQLFDNVLMTTWDLNNRQSYVVTKRNFQDPNNTMPMSSNLDWALVSGANPKYFKPVVKDDKAFIGGDAVALSPAFLAYMQAVDIENMDPKIIRVMSIGSIYERADRIPAKIGLADWLFRVSSLTGLTKKQTQDYLLNKILQTDGSFLMKFHYPISTVDRASIEEMEKPFADLDHLAMDFIAENMQEIEEDLLTLVSERLENHAEFKCN